MASRRTTPRGHVLLEHGRLRRCRVKPCHPTRGQRLDTCAAAVRLVNRESGSRKDFSDEPFVQLGKLVSESRARQTRFCAGEPGVGGAVAESGATMRNGDISVAGTQCDQRSRVAFRKRGARTGGNDSDVGRGGPLCRGGWRPGLLQTSRCARVLRNSVRIRMHRCSAENGGCRNGRVRAGEAFVRLESLTYTRLESLTHVTGIAGSPNCRHEWLP